MYRKKIIFIWGLIVGLAIGLSAGIYMETFAGMTLSSNGVSGDRPIMYDIPGIASVHPHIDKIFHEAQSTRLWSQFDSVDLDLSKQWRVTSLRVDSCHASQASFKSEIIHQ